VAVTEKVCHDLNVGRLSASIGRTSCYYCYWM